MIIKPKYIAVGVFFFNVKYWNVFFTKTSSKQETDYNNSLLHRYTIML